MPLATGYAPSDKIFRRVTRALEGAQGFPPAASSLDAGWRRFVLNCWRGAAEEVAIDQIPDLQVVVHTGGIAAIPFLIGGRLNAARSSSGMVTIMPPGTRHRWLVQGEVHSATLHFSTQCDVPEGIPSGCASRLGAAAHGVSRIARCRLRVALAGRLRPLALRTGAALPVGCRGAGLVVQKLLSSGDEPGCARPA